MLNTAIKEIQPYYNSPDITMLLSEVDIFCHDLLPFLTKKTYNPHIAKILLLKIANLLIAKYHFRYRHTSLISQPFGLLVDPCNSCPLQCPGCLHGSYLKTHKSINWPGGLLAPHTFENLINQFGPYALYIHFFNWGEPLLNRRTPDFIKQSKKYGIDTVISTNLNVNFDAEKLVLSGLDFLIMSIDGATPKTYNKYRRGGDFDFVINNIKKLVAAKKRHNTTKPTLQWQFLTFEHNIHEINTASQMAQNLGINSIRFAKPYDVSWAEPSIKVDGNHTGIKNIIANTINSEDWIEKGGNDLSIFRQINLCYERKWLNKLLDKKVISNRVAKNNDNICHWLYKNIVMDAHGRILPCCYVPQKSDEYYYTFASIVDNQIFNSKRYIKAREIELGRSRKKANLTGGKNKLPYCSICDNHKIANIDSRHIRQYFTKHNKSWTNDSLLSEESITLLANWG